VVADDVVMESPDRQIRLMDAVDEREGAEVGDFIEEQIENAEFGRIAAQAAKQVIVQRVREAERAQVVEAWKDRVGELVTGIVKRVERGNIYVDLGGNAEAIIPKDKAIPRDVLRAGDRVRGYLFDVRAEVRGPQLFISRAAPEFMMELFKLEVPEVGQGLVEIKAARATRATAPRSPCSPTTPHRSDRRLHRHARFARAGGVQRAQRRAHRHRAVERQPGPVRHQRDGAGRGAVDHRRRGAHSMDLAVAEDKLSQAIGKGGQNVRLASKLTGWQLNVMTQDQVVAKSEAEQAARASCSRTAGGRRGDRRHPGREGFSTVEEIAYVPVGELLAVEGSTRTSSRSCAPAPAMRCSPSQP
jgi:transcription termination/antitermination protein NusA